MTDEKIDRTPRTQLKRFHKRASFDRATINEILDEALIGHMGFSVDGQPYVIPTAFARWDDRLVLHGSAASRALRTLKDGAAMCVTVTLTDGLVLARTAFNHSFNYRSVVVLGTATPIVSAEEKEDALELFTNKLVPGRWDDIRWPTKQELKATTVLTMPLDEVSAKIRVGPPVDEGDDLKHECWAGVVPLETRVLPPISSPDLTPGVTAPGYVRDYRLKRPS